MTAIPHDDDDGIIDLHALTRPKAAAAAPLFPSEPPPAAFTFDASGRETPKRVATGTLVAAIAGGLIVLVVAGLGLRHLFRGDEPVALAKLTAATTAPAAQADPPPAPAASAPDPAPAATAADGDKTPAPAASGKASKKGRGFARAAAAKRAASDAPAAAAAAAPAAPRPSPKAADPCGCKGNFDCNLRCAASGK